MFIDLCLFVDYIFIINIMKYDDLDTFWNTFNIFNLIINLCSFIIYSMVILILLESVIEHNLLCSIQSIIIIVSCLLVIFLLKNISLSLLSIVYIISKIVNVYSYKFFIIINNIIK